MFAHELGRLFGVLTKVVILLFVRIRYSRWTVAEYYRKQGAQIGENCRIDFISFGEEPYCVSIGNHVCIAPNVVLHTHDGGAWVLRNEIPDLQILGKIVIEDNCLIGASAHLFPNIRIGKNSIVGAGSVVISDVPPNSIVMGVPARVIGSTIKYRERHVAAWKENVKAWEKHQAIKSNKTNVNRWFPSKRMKRDTREFGKFLINYKEELPPS